MVKDITYGKLREALASLGYIPEDPGSDTVIFRNPNRRLRIFLPKMGDEEFVLPVDLLSTRSTLVDDGVRLWVGGHLLIDKFNVTNKANEFSGSVALGEKKLKRPVRVCCNLAQ